MPQPTFNAGGKLPSNVEAHNLRAVDLAFYARPVRVRLMRLFDSLGEVILDDAYQRRVADSLELAEESLLRPVSLGKREGARGSSFRCID